MFKRVALNPQTMQNISAWFIQKIVYKVPNKDGLDYHWFYFEKGMSLPCVRILDVRLGRLQGLTYQVNVNDAIFVRKVNQPKRITLTQKVKALMAMEYEGIPVLGQFSESDGSEFVSPKSE